MPESERLDIVVVIGNPNPGGRTTRVGQAVADAVGSATPQDAAIETIELAEIAAHLFEWGNEDVAALTARVAAADVIVAACPTYKATFTGLLKAFLDSLRWMDPASFPPTLPSPMKPIVRSMADK